MFCDNASGGVAQTGLRAGMFNWATLPGEPRRRTVPFRVPRHTESVMLCMPALWTFSINYRRFAREHTRGHVGPVSGQRGPIKHPEVMNAFRHFQNATLSCHAHENLA